MGGGGEIPHPIVLLVTGENLLRARDGKAQDAPQAGTGSTLQPTRVTPDQVSETFTITTNIPVAIGDR